MGPTGPAGPTPLLSSAAAVPSGAGCGAGWGPDPLLPGENNEAASRGGGGGMGAWSHIRASEARPLEGQLSDEAESQPGLRRHVQGREGECPEVCVLRPCLPPGGGRGEGGGPPDPTALSRPGRPASSHPPEGRAGGLESTPRTKLWPQLHHRLPRCCSRKGGCPRSSEPFLLGAGGWGRTALLSARGAGRTAGHQRPVPLCHVHCLPSSGDVVSDSEPHQR